MTKKWGPLGWATLHSIAALYPDAPSPLEIELFGRWLRAFTDTILCPSCLSHFAQMVSDYDRTHPGWRTSRRTVCEFVFRAHNTVNVRTHKKTYTFRESIEELERVFPAAHVTATRQQYLVYIRSDWMRNMTLSGISSFSKIRELNTIESGYWGGRVQPEWSELLQFEGTTSVAPLEAIGASNLGATNVPKLVAPSRGFSLKSVGRIGQLSSLR
jgi:hypothetical protein